jgi:ppGpp synthetase/RelA/SpoT-type nucleotidyltranferase
MAELTRTEELLIEELIALFNKRKVKLTSFLEQIRATVEPETANGGQLYGLVHSTKSRIKSESSLREKLGRKIKEGKEPGKEPYVVTLENLFQKVNDLVAYRIMHIHPRQMEYIHPALLELFREKRLDLNEDPEAKVWDLETKKYFESVVKIKTKHTEDRLYSSVHYVVKSNSTLQYTCEIQVRTLADELWGELDHSINYPEKLESIACREQIKSLAHMTTSCNRLADSIFESHREWKELTKPKS